MREPSRFWDRIAERYARRPVADEAAYQKKLEITRGYFHPDSEVLEFGCGTGSTAIAHAPHVRHIRAVDFSARMLEIARYKAAASGVANITFEQAGIDTVAVEDHSVDVVLALSLLHLLEDRDAAIARIYTALKPGGVFVSNTACIGDMAWVFPIIIAVGRFVGLVPLVKVFTLQALEDSLTGAGFRIETQWQPGKRTAVFIVARKPG